MKTTIPYLVQKLEKYSPILIGKSDTYPILAIQWFHSNDKLSKDILYIVRDTETMQSMSNVSGIHFLFCGNTVPLSDLDSSIILLIAPCNSNEVFFEIEQIILFNLRLSNCSACLQRIVKEDGSLQSLVKETYQLIGNPIYIFDAGFNLISAMWDEKKLDEKTKLIINNGYLNEEDLYDMNYEHYHDKVRKSSVPILVKNKKFGYSERIITMINKTGKNLGHISVVNNIKPFEEIDFEMVEILRDAVSQLLNKDTFIKNTKGFNYEYFIADILDQKILTNKQFKIRMNQIDCEFLDAFYVLIVDTGKSNGAINNKYICNRLEVAIPGIRPIVYNEQIVAIITRNYTDTIQDSEIATINKFCIENALYCGLSNKFKKLIDLPNYYQQALKAIELGVKINEDPSLFIYNHYYINHLMNTFNKYDSGEVFCHPDMSFLLKYDKKNGTELGYSLYMFLLNERNLIKTSNAMNIHRNTLIYRLKKIDSLISINLDDYNIRQYLIISYQIMNR